MNYIIGFLYINFQNDNATLAFFVTLLDNYFKGMFSKDLEKLKVMFY